MPAYITRTSILTDITRTLKLEKIEQEELERILYAYKEGIIPDLHDYLITNKDITHDAITFIIDGTTREEREKYLEGRV
jgi:hypothetical protein